jgi:Domain of unknown function (DUF4406)
MTTFERTEELKAGRISDFPAMGGGSIPRRIIAQPDRSDPWFAGIAELLPPIHGGGGRYWYLAGPMSGRPGFNYGEFDRIARILRDQAYPVVSPAEFEHEQQRKRIMEANGDEPHDSVGPKWEDCLARDVCVVANPRCVGVIVIEGWHKSRGATLETHVAHVLGRPVFEFSEDPLQLTQIDPKARAEELDDIEDAREAIAHHPV